MPVTFAVSVLTDGELSANRARLKWSETIEAQSRKAKIKGKALFLHGMKGGKFTLAYYQSYGTDWCDTVFTGEIAEYDDGKSQIFGKVTASPAMKRFAVGAAVGIIPLLLLIFVVSYYGFGVYLPSVVYYGGIAAAAVSAVMSLAVDKNKTKIISEYLYNFLKEDQHETD